MIVKLAGLNIDWKLNDDGFFADFLVNSENAEPCVMTINGPESFGESHGIRFTQTGFSKILHRQYGELEMMCSNEDWSYNTLYCNAYNDQRFTLPLAVICSRFSFFDTLLLHGALVDCCGNGIVFTGYSGVGKTTQAELWKKYQNAEIINGDKVFVRQANDGVYCYGLPWHGSSGYCLNKSVVLTGIVVLRQGQENRITRLNSVQCMEYFMPHIFLPNWDKDSLLSALKTVDNIIEKVPVWLLECRPDEDAVSLTKNTVFKNYV